jgi:aldehyde dehydrogenase (NAD+)
LPSVSGQTFENRNPENTDDLIGIFQKSTAADVARAIDAAKRAYEHWRLVPAPPRQALRRTGALADRKEALARDMTREMGKVLDETRGDVQEAIDMTFFMAGEGRRQYGQTVPSELRDKFAMSVRQPLGVSAIITPWNFPMAIPSWKIIPALVCGNTVVFKPATLTPLSALNFVRILEEAGLPAGVVNLVTGGGGDVGSAMLVNDDVRVVSFTGSTDVGRTVSEKAAPSFKKVHLEMGGKNVIMVMDDANLDLAVEGCLWGGFGTTGQRCTAASRVVVHERVYRPFLDRFVTRARALRVGEGLDPGSQMGPLVSAEQRETVMEYVEIGAKEGATLACGGHALTTGAYAKGFFHEPTIFSEVSPQMRIAREEIFGRSSASCDANRSRKRSPSPTAYSTASRRQSTRRMSTAPFRPCATSTPASSTSTPRPSAPRSTCRSAARRPPATAIARPGRRPSRSSRSGSLSTSTSAASSSVRKSTRQNSDERASQELVNWKIGNW